jgi:hypothetical protein
VNAKRDPAFEVDEEMLALARYLQDVVLCERGDHATLQAGAVETLADQSAGQKGRECVDGVAFGHALNLHPADKKTPRDAGRANSGELIVARPSSLRRAEGFPNLSDHGSAMSAGYSFALRWLASTGSAHKKTPPEAGNTTRSQKASKEAREIRGIGG